MNRPTSLFLLPLVGLVGCSSDPPAPSEVRNRIATDLVAVTNDAKASTADGKSLPDTTQFSLLQTALGSPFEGVLASQNTSISFLRSKASRLTSLFAPRATTSTRLPATGDTTDPYDGAAAAQWLNDNIFTDANEASPGVYNIPASLACTDEVTGDLDADCAQAWAKLQLRIRVSEDDELLRFSLQIGPDHDEPLSVGLGAHLLSLTIDLDEAEHAARALASKFGGQLPNFALDGQITATLEIPGANAARVSLDIDRNVRIRFADPGESLDGPNAFDFSSAKAHVFSLALDGNQHSMTATVGLGATAAHVPDDIDGAVDLDLPGVTGGMKYVEGEPLQLTSLGLGDRTTTLKIDGQLAAALDLNPDDGRALDAQLSTVGVLEVFPKLDLRAQVNHAVLGDAQPVYDVTRVFLVGGLRGRADGVEVVGGTFRIETNPASYGFSAVSGQCVSGDDSAGYTQFTVGACN